MKKEFQIAAKLNFEDFDKSIGDMQRKLKDIYSPSNAVLAQQQMQQRLGGMGIAGAGGASSPAAQAQYKAQSQQVRRELDQQMASEFKAQQNLVKQIVERDNKLKEMVEKQKSLVKGTAEELALQKEIAKVKENNARNMDNYRQRDQSLGEMADLRQKMQPKPGERMYDAIKNGGLKGGIGEAKNIWSEQSTGSKVGLGMGGLAAVLGAVGSGLQTGGEFYRYFGRAPIEATSHMGSAISGTFGKEVNNAYSGRSAMEMAFLPERAAASRMALDNMNRTKNTQWTDIIGSGLKQGAVGMGVGALGGAAFGGVGAIPGAIGMGALGFAGGVGHALMGADKNVLLSPFSKTADAARRADLANQFATDYQTSYEGLKNQNPLKTAAAEEYNQNYSRNLDFQRSTGLDYNSFHGKGGFRERSINAGFMDTQAMNESASILAGGGSTRMAQNSTLGLQAQRAYGITNSGNVLGKISSTLGDDAASKKAFIDAIAEGQRRGLDSSMFAEENRKFMDAAAGIIAGTGSQNSKDISDTTGRFGGFVNDKTTAGIGAAQSAFQTYTDVGSQSSGPRGVMRFGAMMKDPKLGAVSGMDKASLMAIPDNQLTADNPVVQGIADKYPDLSPEQIVKSMKGANDSSRNRTGAADEIVSKGRQLVKDLNNEQDPAKKKDIQAQIKKAQNAYSVYLARENPDLAKDQVKMNSYTLGTFQDTGDSFAGNSKTVQDALDQKKTGRVEDTTTQANAEASRMVLDNFNDLKDTLVTTAEQVAIFNNALKITVEEAMKLPEAQRNKMLGAIGYTGFVNKNQPQAGAKGDGK